MIAHMFERRKALKIAFISLVALLLVWTGGSTIFVKVFYDGRFARLNQPHYSAYLRYGDVSGYPRSVIAFKSGNNLLAGYIYSVSKALFFHTGWCIFQPVCAIK